MNDVRILTDGNDLKDANGLNTIGRKQKMNRGTASHRRGVRDGRERGALERFLSARGKPHKVVVHTIPETPVFSPTLQ